MAILCRMSTAKAFTALRLWEHVPDPFIFWILREMKIRVLHRILGLSMNWQLTIRENTLAVVPKMVQLILCSFQCSDEVRHGFANIAFFWRSRKPSVFTTCNQEVALSVANRDTELTAERI